MLRASLAENDIELSPRPIVDGCGDCRTPFADEIMALVDAAVLRDEAEFPDARIRVELALGRAGADRVAMVVGTFEMMLVGGKMGLVKVTSRSMRIFSMMALGYLAFLLINLGLSWFGVFNAYDTPLGWLIGLFGVAMASYSLAIDFESIQRGIAAQLPEKYSWLMGHGLLASLVWLYIEFLRLIAILRSGE